jgi:ABC-type polysaccharide/polyol phosphate export permease
MKFPKVSVPYLKVALRLVTLFSSIPIMGGMIHAMALHASTHKPLYIAWILLMLCILAFWCKLYERVKKWSLQ